MEETELRGTFWEEHKWELVIAFAILIIAALSFGLGYTMARDSARTPIIIEKNSEI